MRGATVFAGVGLAAWAACASPPPFRAGVVTVESTAPRSARLPAWTYWEPVDAPVVEGAPPAELPLAPDGIVRIGGAEARWSAAPLELREAVVTRGFAVTAPPRRVDRVGDLYAGLRDEHVPTVVTLDALFFAAHLALDRAHAEADAALVVPNLTTMLRRLDVRLGNGAHNPPPDLAAAYLVARGVIAVAEALAEPRYKPPADLAGIVDAERARVIAHSGVGVSPWLGVPLDYSAMAPVGQADRDEDHAGWFRAVAWLGGAALALEGNGEDATHSAVDVGTARAQSRAALLIAHVLQHDVDPEAESAWAKIDRASEVLVGDADDPSPHDLLAAIAGAHVDPAATPDWLTNVVLVDRVRRTCARARAGRVEDGADGPRAPRQGLDAGQPIGLLAPSFRLLGSRVTPDAEVLQSLVFPRIGPLVRSEPPPTARDGARTLPSAFDVAAWLGAVDARTVLHEAGDDAYERYPESLDRLRAGRPRADSIDRHRTAYRSALDAIETWISPSVGDRVQYGTSTAAWRARKIGVALGAWAELRHDAIAMSRIEVPEIKTAAKTGEEPAEPVFVEPHPEAIAEIVAVLRQASRALVAEGAIAKDGPAATLLDEVADLGWDALGVAVAEASDQRIASTLAASVGTLPSRLQAIEAQLGSRGGADVPLVVGVHADLPAGRVLEEGLGRVQEIWMAMREPVTHRVVLALGASLPHLEDVEAMGARLSDGGWGARLDRGDVAPSPLERQYVVAPGRGATASDAGPE